MQAVAVSAAMFRRNLCSAYTVWRCRRSCYINLCGIIAVLAQRFPGCHSQLASGATRSMETAAPPTRRRLRQKTTPTVGHLAVLAAVVAAAAEHQVETDAWQPAWLDDEYLPEEDTDHRKAVYLVTFPALQAMQGLRGRVCPSTLSREQIADMILDAVARPVYTDARYEGGNVKLLNFVVFQERHAVKEGETQGLVHYHVALQAAESFRFSPVKRALQQRHGVATHWSTSHDGYWSAVRYGAMPSPKKPKAEDLDPKPLAWSRSGQHKPLFEASQEPKTAAALKRKREASVKEAAAKGTAEPRATEMDLYPVIVEQGFRNTADDQFAAERLVKHLKENSTMGLYKLAFKMRHKLSALIDDVWSWEEVDDTLMFAAQSRLQLLAQVAQKPCPCGGRWRQIMEHALHLNGISPQLLCTDVYLSLRDGRREDRATVVLMGRAGGEGKSFFFKPFGKIFGDDFVFGTPQPGNFPLLDLQKKKVVLLDEWVFGSAVVPLATQLLWLEGKAFPITRPQNKEYTGHLMYRGSAPIFVTCKAKDLGPILERAAYAMSCGQSSQDTMLTRRLRVYHFTVKFPVDQEQGHIYECPVCLANMILQHSQGVR
jgi:hypothetical protein